MELFSIRIQRTFQLVSTGKAKKGKGQNKGYPKRKAAQGGYSIILQPDGKILRHGNQRRRHSHPSA